MMWEHEESSRTGQPEEFWVSVSYLTLHLTQHSVLHGL